MRITCRLLHEARLCVAIATLGAAPATTAVAQEPDSTTPVRGAFIGRLFNSADSTPVISADVRLAFVDSTRRVRTRSGDSLEVFVDSTRGRIGVSKASGEFVIPRLEPGRYVLHIRRIGYTPLQGALSVDTSVVFAVFPMHPFSNVLAQIVVTETRLDKLKDRLKRVGYEDRARSGLAATFVNREEILRRKPRTVGEIFDAYGLHIGDVIIDRMPLDYETARNYPAELVIGIEIFRHGRPSEFNATRQGRGAMSGSRSAAIMTPLVMIWTYIPGPTNQ